MITLHMAVSKGVAVVVEQWPKSLSLVRVSGFLFTRIPIAQSHRHLYTICALNDAETCMNLIIISGVYEVLTVACKTSNPVTWH